MTVLRMCVVCKRKAEKGNLLRFVVGNSDENASPGDVVPLFDSRQTAEGRGSYTHLDQDCLSSRNLMRLLLASLFRNASRRTPIRCSADDISSFYEILARRVRRELDKMSNADRLRLHERKKRLVAILETIAATKTEASPVVLPLRASPARRFQIRL